MSFFGRSAAWTGHNIEVGEKCCRCENPAQTTVKIKVGSKVVSETPVCQAHTMDVANDELARMRHEDEAKELVET